MQRSGALQRLADGYNHLEEYLLVSSLVLNVLIVFIQVVMRTVFRNSLTWSEELSRYLFIWQIWLGTSIALKYREHIRVTLALNYIRSERAKAGLRLVAEVIWFLFCAYMIFNGTELLLSMMGRNALSSGLRVPLVAVYAAFPVSSALVCIRLLGVLREDFGKLLGRRGGEAQ